LLTREGRPDFVSHHNGSLICTAQSEALTEGALTVEPGQHIDIVGGSIG
jgi:hypothetical protein